MAKNIACTFVFKKERSGRTKRVQQAKRVFGTGSAVEGIPTADKGIEGPRIADSSAVHLMDLPKLFQIFKDQIWIIVPTTNVSFLQAVSIHHQHSTKSALLRQVREALECLPSGHLQRATDGSYGSCKNSSEKSPSTPSWLSCLFIQLLCILVAATALRAESGQTDQASYMWLVQAGSSDATDVLLEQALRLLDSEGILREPSLRGLEALRLLMMLTSEENAKIGRHGNNYRSFQSTYVEHLRILVQDGKLSRDHISAFFLSLIINDSFASAISGQIPAFTDDDIENLAFFMQTDTLSLLNNIANGV